jgi:beta-phosphoglucomutase
VEKIANELHIDFTLEHNELLKSREYALDIILEIGKVEASQDKKKWLIQKNDTYNVLDMDQSELLPGVLSMLHYLKDQPIALGSAKNARPILEKTGIRHYFDAIVDGNDVTNAKNRRKYS